MNRARKAMLNTDDRLMLLRLVLAFYAVAHLMSSALFLFWPRYAVLGSGPRPPFPLSVLQFGSWPPFHQGFMNVIGAYDLAIAVAFVIAATNPVKHSGLVSFFLVLLAVHGGVHAAQIIWGDSPSGQWLEVAQLWAGFTFLAALFPRPASARGGVKDADARVSKFPAPQQKAP